MTFGNGPALLPRCANLARGELELHDRRGPRLLPPGATFLRSEAEVQTIGLFDRPMTCPVDFW